MDHADVVELLAYAACYDHRKASESQELAWLDALGDLPLDWAKEGVRAHYAVEVDRVMPGHVRRQVGLARQRLREERERTRRVLPAVGGQPPSEEYLAARARLDAHLADRRRGREGPREPSALGDLLAPMRHPEGEA